MARTPSLRIDLADIADPAQLAEAVLALSDATPGAATPINAIALALDILEVKRAPLRRTEGILLTDKVRTVGSILANDCHGHEGRIRFTIAHELGHFLLEHHGLETTEGFACTAGDMALDRGGDRHALQEREANRFAIEVLAPRKRLSPVLEEDPDLRVAHRLAQDLVVSREALLRRMVDLHSEPLAVIFAHNGRIRFAPRHPAFPWLHGVKGSPLPLMDDAEDVAGVSSGSGWIEAPPGRWCDRHPGGIFQQVHTGRDGYTTVLLWHRT
ncbi:ImmA/IrrE family metallo-endopeptidase [Paracoccus sp. TK19116]|uniref:ImmA/IrrE family metallo-endopeptidase n=1 Tax=Paracoccus albicereus TaxID=2922394 RepID=A0ABT1MTG4_9RHOB|nr:ImmA/IrrE family metallo-endopeptidase [Paracoccus albicereus]MCQ0970156.1 ImmA/IrrE family metallo-endopeptidase [Paracoccus albicereus]